MGSVFTRPPSLIFGLLLCMSLFAFAAQAQASASEEATSSTPDIAAEALPAGALRAAVHAHSSTTDLSAVGEQLAQRGQRLRVGGWASLATGVAGFALAGGLTKIVLDAEDTFYEPNRPIYRLDYGARRAIPASVAGASLLLTTAVAIPQLVIGQRYRRAGRALQQGDTAAFYDQYATLQGNSDWNHRLVVSAQKRRAARALYFSTLAVTGTATALLITGLLTSHSGQGAPTTTDKLSIEGGKHGWQRPVLIGAGASLGFFVAVPLLISGISVGARAKNIARRENAQQVQVMVSPILAQGGGGASLHLSW